MNTKERILYRGANHKLWDCLNAILNAIPFADIVFQSGTNYRGHRSIKSGVDTSSQENILMGVMIYIGKLFFSSVPWLKSHGELVPPGLSP